LDLSFARRIYLAKGSAFCDATELFVATTPLLRQVQLLALARELFRRGLLKVWDSSKHPRLGGPPDSGEFADKPKVPRPSRRRWAPKEANRDFQDWVKKKLNDLAERMKGAAKDIERDAEEIGERVEAAGEFAEPTLVAGAEEGGEIAALGLVGGAAVAAAPEIAIAAIPEIVALEAPELAALVDDDELERVLAKLAAESRLQPENFAQTGISQMTEFNFAGMTLEDLTQALIDKARRVHCYLNFGAPMHKVTPETDAIEEEIYAIGAELTERNSAAHARRLMDHDDRNVGAWAASRLRDVDEEWADAASTALCLDFPTREVIAYREHTTGAERSPAPAWPSRASNNSPPATKTRGLRKYAEQFMRDDDDPWTVNLRNSVIDELIAIANELKRRGTRAALLPFLQHENVGLRTGAAAMSLVFAPERAAPVLGAIAEGRDPEESVGAAGILYRWQFDQKEREAQNRQL
jgi:Domain of unknown function (DUF2019)